MTRNSGSVFLMALAILAILTVAAYGFLAAAQASRETASTINHLHLARMAARAGQDQAVAILRRDYLGLAGPTHPLQPWQTAFAPIDQNRNFADPSGWPTNDDDVAPDDIMYGPLLRWRKDRLWPAGPPITLGDWPHETASIAGLAMSTGRARWLEPGWGDASPTTRVPFTQTTPLPTLQDPCYLDSDWNLLQVDPADPAMDTWAKVRAKARYRLRYAVSVTDLCGLLLPQVQGPWRNEATASVVAWTAAPWALDELDNEPPVLTGAAPWRSAMYALPFFSMGTAAEVVSGVNETQLARLFAGRGGGYGDFQRWGDEGRPGVPVAGFQAGTTRPLDLGNLPIDTAISAAQPITSVVLTQSARHPSFSWQTLQRHFEQNDGRVSQFLFTPFGRATDPAETDQGRWYWGPSACPWRVNLLTAPPAVLRAMVYGYLPGEAKIYNGSLTKETYTGRDANTGMNLYGAPSSTVPNTQAYLGWDRRTLAWPLVGGAQQWIDAGGDPWSTASTGPDPYPGDPANQPAGWTSSLGAFATINRLGDGQLGTVNAGLPVNITAYAPWNTAQPLDPLTTAPYHYMYRQPVIVLAESPGADQNGDGKIERWTLNPPANCLTTLTGPDESTTGGYVNPDSYFLDIAQALMHTLAVARAAWQDRLPDATGGDGIPDTPSAFDSIAELDRAFVEAMGEGWGSRNATAGSGRFLRLAGDLNGQGGTQRWFGETVTINLATTAGSKTISGSGLSADQQNLLELVLNDVRMSFFGASPQYAASFRPKDFSGDGQVYCSCYRDPATASSATATNAWRTWRAAGAYDGPAPASLSRLRSVTGCFVIQKSRFWRILVRGQVWDERFRRVISEANLDSVYAVDPDGSVIDRDDVFRPGETSTTTTGLDDSGFLFQKWLVNPNRQGRPVVYP